MLRRSFLLGVIATSLFACPKGDANRLVVYSGRSEALVGPVFERFKKANPEVELDVRYNKTPALASQLLAEGEQSPADVIWFQDVGYLGALGGTLKPLPESLIKKVDPRFIAKNRRWVGITGRLRVLVYSTKTVEQDNLPKSLEELADPKWKGKLGWAPGNASFQAHVSALRHLWGEDKTKAWLTGMKANEPARYPKNSPQVQAAASGEISIGWVNHYYLHKLKTGDFAAANYSFPNDADAGNLLMLAGAAIRSGTKKAALSERLLAFLLTDETQSYFAQTAYEYPTVPDVATHADVTPMSQLKLTSIEAQHLADVEPTLAMLSELGIE